MIKLLLSFSEVTKSELIHLSTANRPGMAEVPLLNAGGKDNGESGKQPAWLLQLKSREWIGPVVVVKIVVRRKLLRRGNLVVQSYCELVTAFIPIRTRRNLARSKRGHILVINSQRRRIETLCGNVIIRKNGSERLRRVSGGRS